VTGLTIATLFPHATVAAGDEANATALARRAAARGITARLVTVTRPQEMVEAGLYLLGGSGRTWTASLIQLLDAAGLPDRVGSAGPAIFAVDAGMDALARSWTDPADMPRAGLGLLGFSTRPAAPVTDSVLTRADRLHGLPAMIGWIAQDVQTVRDPGLLPLAEIERGATHPALEPDGVLGERVVATRLHGPVLALNPELADLVLGMALGDDWRSWPPVASPAAARARAQRIAEIRSTAVPANGRRGRGRRR
jgi:CobQ-like glutamine amidotransferase family enzyme